MTHAAASIVAPGFFGSSVVRVAIAVGALAAIVSAVVGVFTVIRGQSFAGEALGDVGTTGGAGAFLVGVGPLAGFVVMNIVAAAAMELVGIQRPRGRDLATGIVLGGAIGLAALFFYLATVENNTTGATVTVLFGSVFAISSSTVPVIVVLGVLTLALMAAIHRPLLLASLSAEMASARGIPVRMIGALHLLALALATALAAITIGTILSTALLVGPAASALRLTKRPLLAIATAAGIGITATWLGIVLAYDSYDWPPVHQGWPVSFFVVSLVFVFYLLSGVPDMLRRHRSGQVAAAPLAPSAESAGS